MVREITLDLVREQIRNIPDFPRPGIQFKDITTVLKQPELFNFIVDSFAEQLINKRITKVVGIESRGFILGGALAARLGAGFIPMRKPGKLPAAVFRKSYELEYGSNILEIHKDAMNSNDIVLIHDDLLATGGTAKAAVELISNFSPREISLCFLCELDFLNGRQKLRDKQVTTLIHI